MTSTNANIVAELGSSIKIPVKSFTGDVIQFPKFKEKVKRDAIAAGLDVETIHAKPVKLDFVTDPAKQVDFFNLSVLVQMLRWVCNEIKLHRLSMDCLHV